MSSGNVSEGGPGRKGEMFPDSFHLNKTLVDRDGGDCPEQEVKDTETDVELPEAEMQYVQQASVLENLEQPELTNTHTTERSQSFSVENVFQCAHSFDHVEIIEERQNKTSAHPCQGQEKEVPESPYPHANDGRSCLANPNVSSEDNGNVYFQDPIIVTNVDSRDSEETQKITNCPQEPTDGDTLCHILSTSEHPPLPGKFAGDSDRSCALDNTMTKSGKEIDTLDYPDNSLHEIFSSPGPCKLFNHTSSNTVITKDKENQSSSGQDATASRRKDDVVGSNPTQVETEDESCFVSNDICHKQEKIEDARTCLEDAKFEHDEILKLFSKEVNENVDGNVPQSYEVSENIVFDKNKKMEEVRKDKIENVRRTTIQDNEVIEYKVIELHETKQTVSAGSKQNKPSNVFQITESEAHLLEEIIKNDTRQHTGKKHLEIVGQEGNKRFDQDKQSVLALQEETQVCGIGEMTSEKNSKTCSSNKCELDSCEPSQFDKYLEDKNLLTHFLYDTGIENSSKLKLNSNKIDDPSENVEFDQGGKKEDVRVNETKDVRAFEPTKVGQNITSLDIKRNRDSEMVQTTKITDSEANLLTDILEYGTQQEIESGKNAERQIIGDMTNKLSQQIKLFQKETHQQTNKWENKTQLPNFNDRKRKVRALREDFLKRAMPNCDTNNMLACKESTPTPGNSIEELISEEYVSTGTFKQDEQDGYSAWQMQFNKCFKCESNQLKTESQGGVHNEGESCIQLSQSNKHTKNDSSPSNLLLQDQCSTRGMNSIQSTIVTVISDNGSQVATGALGCLENACQKNIIYKNLTSQARESPHKVGGRILSRKSQNIQRLQQQLQQELEKKNKGTSEQMHTQNIPGVSGAANWLCRPCHKYKRSISRSCGPPAGAHHAVVIEKRPYRQWQRVSNCLAPDDRFIVSAAPKCVFRIGEKTGANATTPETNEMTAHPERQMNRQSLNNEPHGVNNFVNNSKRANELADISTPGPEASSCPGCEAWHESQTMSERRGTVEYQGIHTTFTARANSDTCKMLTADPKETTCRYDLRSACVIPCNETRDLMYVTTPLQESTLNGVKSSTLDCKEDDPEGNGENIITTSVKRIVIRKEKELDKEHRQPIFEKGNPLIVQNSSQPQPLSLSLIKERRLRSASPSSSSTNNSHHQEFLVNKLPPGHHPDTLNSVRNVPQQNKSPRVWPPDRQTSLSPRIRQAERNNSHPWTAFAASEGATKQVGSLGEAHCVCYSRDSLSKERSPSKRGIRPLARYSRARSRHVTEARTVSRGVKRIVQPSRPQDTDRRSQTHRIFNLWQMPVVQGSKVKEVANTSKRTKYIKVKAREDYTGCLPGQLSFKKGQVLKQRQLSPGRAVRDNMAYGYYRVGRLRKKLRGLFPVSLVTENLNDEVEFDETPENEHCAV